MEDESKRKQIDLQIRKEWLEKIVSGEKKEDYRTLSRYNMNLLTRAYAKMKFRPREDITHVRFVAGFSNDRKYAVCEINGIFADKFVNFVPEGMKPGTVALTIEIRRVVEHNLNDDGKESKKGSEG